MGQLVDGRWVDRGYDTSATGGRFVRADAGIRHRVTADGSPGPSGEGGLKAAPGRYHLTVSLACPWAHRALIVRALKGLEPLIGVSVVHWLMLAEGWTFAPGAGCTGDRVNGMALLRELYTLALPRYSGRVTVPVLWDVQRQTIVSNESAEIVRMLNGAFDHLGAAPLDLYPAALRAEIDRVNARVYAGLNNGVYRAGFATTQDAYDEAVAEVFATLDWLEERLGERRWLAGDAITEADWRAFTTLIRFDAVYHGHFKCNLRRLVDYPRLWAYTRALHAVPGIAATVDLDHIKRHYYQSHRGINPTGIVPAGPQLDWTAATGRG